ncbi:hypothetical protein N7451_003108 [Penicillium sp. IBT 35674x]|nr:hypothetical protein N7451_003108 [Penicillium sp. IBT 35674x]
MHEIYGPVVRVSPHELAFSTAKAWEDIYGHRQGRPNMDKSSIHVGAVEPLEGASTLTMADDATHSRQRRALAHAFSQRALMEQEDIIQLYVNKFIAGVGNFCDEAFGEPFGCLDQGKFHEWVAMIYETVKAGAMEQATRRFATPGSSTQRLLMNFIPAKKREDRRNHLAYSLDKAMRRLQNERLEHKDFIWYILRAKEKEDINLNEIIVNAALFIVAGSETTANELSGLSARLMSNPRVHDKLVAEIRTNIKKEEDLTNENLMKLPYLHMCLSEGLRIHPLFPLACFAQCRKVGTISMVIGNKASQNPIPKSTETDKLDPGFRKARMYEFIPERWSDSEYNSDNKKASQPFSLGPRGCIGRHLSYMEMRLILGKLLWYFDIASADGAPQWDPNGEMKYMKAYNTWEKPELNVYLKRRVSQQ